jgi:hypothetical protein
MTSAHSPSPRFCGWLLVCRASIAIARFLTLKGESLLLSLAGQRLGGLGLVDAGVAAPPRTFADLEPAGLEMAVTCQRCGQDAVVDNTAPRLRRQRIAGRRYRCARYGAIGLPSLGTRRLAERAGKLKVDMSGAELSG